MSVRKLCIEMRGLGIGPRSTGWKPVVLPLNYPRVKLNIINSFLNVCCVTLNI